MAKRKQLPIKGKTMNPALMAMSKEARARKLLNSAEKTNLLLTIMSLHDEMEFSKEQIELFLKGYRRQIDCYASRNLPCGTDMEIMIKEDYDIDIDDFLRGIPL